VCVDAGGTLKILNANDVVKNTFDITRVSDTIELIESKNINKVIEQFT
jgi:hypothetical protein